MSRLSCRPTSRIPISMPTLATLFIVLCLPAFSSAEDAWPQWRGPNRDGLSEAKGLNWKWTEKAPKLLWTAEGLGRGYSSVSLADGVIYTTGNTKDGQCVVAISADGERQWIQPVTDSPPQHGYGGARCTPTIDGEYLYVVSSNGGISCVRRGDGTIVWQKLFSEWDGQLMKNWGYSESPLVDGDLVLCTPGGEDALIVALDKKTGDQVWSAKLPKGNFAKGLDGAGYSSMVISHGGGVKQYVHLTGRGVIGVRAEDGKVLWVYNKVANGVANIPTPLTFGDYVFCSTGYGTGSALLKLSADGDGVKAEEQYFLGKNELQNHHGGMVMKDGHVYCGHGHGKGFPICVNIKSGDIVWGGKVRGVGDGSAAATVADGHLVLRYQSGEVAAIKASPEKYELVGSFKPDFQEDKSWAHPVIVGTRLYLREQDKLMCYDLAP